MAIWDDILSDVDRAVYEAYFSHRGPQGLGKKPAVLVIDVNYAWVGLKPALILEGTEGE